MDGAVSIARGVVASPLAGEGGALAATWRRALAALTVDAGAALPE